MSIRDYPAAYPQPPAAPLKAFAALHAAPEARLIEIAPALPGDEAATFGFALAWALAGGPKRLMFWAVSDQSLAEHGAPFAEGFAHFGLDLDQCLIVRTSTQADALWAAEQALTLPGALVFCTIAPAHKALTLTATRRLLLAAEKHDCRCVLIRLDAAGASAAWQRWVVSPAPSQGAGRELGAPAFNVSLTRNRAGPTGQSWRLHWNAHEQSFDDAADALDGDLAAAAFDRSVEARRRIA